MTLLLNILRSLLMYRVWNHYPILRAHDSILASSDYYFDHTQNN